MTTWDDILARLERWKNWDGVRNNEQATIQGLILPALRLIGYDVDDPEVVYPQERMSTGRPDFILFDKSRNEGGQPRVVLEAKRLRDQLKPREAGQILDYARKQGIEAQWYVVSNGLHWMLFHRDQLHPVFDLKLGQPGAIEALTLVLTSDASQESIDVATKLLIERQLAKLLEQHSWEDQLKVWSLAQTLITPVKNALQELLRCYPKHKELIGEVRGTLERALRQQSPTPPFMGTDSRVDVFPKKPELSENYPDWSKPFVALATWAYQKDPSKVRATLKVLPLDYSGPLQNSILPGGKERLCTHYDTPNKQRLLSKLAQAFPELKGLELKVKGETWIIP